MFNFLRRPQQVKESLTKTRESFLSKLTSLVAKNELNEDFWMGLEETLIAADVGVETTMELVDKLRERADAKDRQNNLLKNAPHTARQIASDKWDHPYSREQAAFPTPWTREHKFWPTVARIDNVYGDRNLFCSCPPLEDFEG